jgi:hypothetical protein
MPKDLTTSEFVAGLRKLADLYEAHPEVRLPYYLGRVGETIFCHNAEDFAAAVRMFGQGAKSDGGDTLDFTPEFPLPIQVQAFKSDICKRRQVGKRIVAAHPECVIPACLEHVEPIYIWDCKPFLSDK